MRFIRRFFHAVLLIAIMNAYSHATTETVNLRAELASSGKVDQAVIDLFSEETLQSVFIIYKSSEGESNHQEIGERIRLDYSSSTLQLSHQFTLIHGFSTYLDIADAANLAADDRVSKILFDPIGQTTLNQATQIIGSDIVNSSPFGLKGAGQTVAVIDTGLDRHLSGHAGG